MDTALSTGKQMYMRWYARIGMHTRMQSAVIRQLQEAHRKLSSMLCLSAYSKRCNHGWDLTCHFQGIACDSGNGSNMTSPCR